MAQASVDNEMTMFRRKETQLYYILTDIMIMHKDGHSKIDIAKAIYHEYPRQENPILDMAKYSNENIKPRRIMKFIEDVLAVYDNILENMGSISTNDILNGVDIICEKQFILEPVIKSTAELYE